MKKLTIEIASPHDREKLVAEIWQGDQLIAEINQETENLEIEIYAKENPIKLDCKSFLETISEAMNKLNSN